MKKINKEQIEALRQQALNEKETHEKVMKSIDSMKNKIEYGEVTQEEIDSWGEQGWGVSPYTYIQSFKSLVLSEEEMLQIIARKDYTEINALIFKISKISREVDKKCITYLPSAVQCAIINIGDRNLIFDLMHESELHPEAQILIDKRNQDDEIRFMIEKNTIVDDLQVSWVSDLPKFYLHINQKEFAVAAQIKMNQTSCSTEFRNYVNKFGLWETAHLSLLESRNDDDISYYLARHQHLSSEALGYAHKNKSRSFLINYFKLAKSFGRRGFLNKEELWKYFEAKDYEFLSWYQKHYGLDDNSLHLVIDNFSKQEFFDALNRGIRFHNVEEYLLQKKSLNDVQNYAEYVSYKLSRGFYKAVIQKGYDDFLEKLIEKAIGTNNIETIFVLLLEQQRYVDALKCYNKSGRKPYWINLTTFETGFINGNADSDEIKKYIANNKLTDEGFKALCQRGIADEIKLYFSKWI